MIDSSNVISIIGGQWGDEGKGKIVDFLSEGADYCIRFQGGSNAGHTILFDGVEYRLRLMPSGVLRGATGILGAGMVVNLDVLSKEMVDLKSIDPDLFIDHRAHLVLPTHIFKDVCREEASGNRIGTTRNGIGVCYEDKARRIGLRAGDLLSKDLESKVEVFLKAHEDFGSFEMESLLSILDEWRQDWSSYIRTDLSSLLFNEMRSGKKCVIEGAQGTLLDVSHGTYPYVTSSNTIAPSIGVGLGCALPKDAHTIGVFKAYCTRVGKGEFLSEEIGKIGKEIQRIGKEVGVVTERIRRCGWLNLDDMIYAHHLNDFSSIALTKVDVLDGFSQVKVFYRGEMHEFKGWEGSANVDSFADLPDNLKFFISFIEEKSGVPVSIVSNGPDRRNTLLR